MFIFKQYKLHFVIILTWLVIYALNYSVFHPMIYKFNISFIFLPAGIHIIFATLYREQAWLGLFLGAVITGFIFFDTELQPYVFLFSLISASCPILAVLTVNAFTSIGTHLEFLNIKKVIAISILNGIYCLLIHNLTTFYLFNLSWQVFVADSFVMFIGEITGSFILLTLLASQRERILKLLDNINISL